MWPESLKSPVAIILASTESDQVVIFCFVPKRLIISFVFPILYINESLALKGVEKVLTNSASPTCLFMT